MKNKSYQKASAFVLAIMLVCMQFVPTGALFNDVYAADGDLTVDCIHDTPEKFKDIEISTKAAFNAATPNALTLGFRMNSQGKIAMMVQLAIDDTFLADNYIAYISAGGILGDDPPTASVPAIEFKVELSKSIFDLSTMPNGVVQSKGTTIGEYSVTDETTHYLFKMNIESFIYNSWTNVTAGFEVLLDATGDCGPGSTAVFSLVDGHLNAVITPSSGGSGAGSFSDLYKVEKSAPATIKDVGFTYIISATAISTSALDSLWIRDSIPEGLTVTGLRASLDGVTPATNISPEAVMSGNNLAYEISGSGISTAALYVDVMLNEAKYSEYMKGAGKKNNFTFKNSASLENSGATPDSVESATMTTNMELPNLFGKSGKPVGLDANRYEWTIEANTRFSSAANVFIVDRIVDTSKHMYDTSSNVVVTYDTSTANLTPYLLPTENTAFEALTIGGIKALFIANPAKNCLYYTLSDGQAVMLIKLDDNQLNKPLTVKYHTNIVNLSTTKGAVEKLENDAKMVWEMLKYGNGPFPYDDYADVFLKKNTITADNRPLSKAGGSYNEKTQELKWEFEINRLGVTMDGITITDTLDNNEQAWGKSLYSDHDSITFQKYKRDTGSSAGSITIPYDGSVTPSTPYYKFVSAGTGTAIEIHIGKINANDYYTFTLPVKVINPNILSKQGNVSPQQENHATIDATVDSAPLADSITAKKTLHNTLIKKSLVSDYDYTNNSIVWKVTVNPNCLPVTNAMFEDILPRGTEFDEIKSVTRIRENNTTEAGIIGLNNIMFSGLEITYSGISDSTFFKFGSDTTTINDCFEFEFSTKYTDEYQFENFRCEFDEVATNVAILTGKVSEVAISGPAKAQAVHTFSPDPVVKSGEFGKGYHQFGIDDDQLRFVTWSALFNPNQTSMAGVVINDNVKSHFDIVPSSMAVYIATIDKAGKVTSKTALPNADTYFSSLNEREFSFTVGDNISKAALLFEFNTIVVETADKSDMTNEISLDYGNGDSTSTGDQQAKNAQDFNFEDYATMTKAPFLRVIKTSTNTDYDKKGDPLTKLENVEFTLQPMKNDGSGWVSDLDGKILVKRTATSTNANVKGSANFLQLKKDVLYKLSETEAPAGYTTMRAIFYIFDPSGVISDYPTGTQIVSPSGTKCNTTSTLYNNPLTGGAINADEVSFYKKNSDGGNVSGAGFTLKKDGIIPKTAYSDANGKVTFTDVDNGTYTLTETFVPEGLVTMGATTVVVTKSATGLDLNITGSAVSGSHDPIQGKYYTITNTLEYGFVGLTKQAKASSGAVAYGTVSGAVFGVYTSPGNVHVAYITDPTSTGAYKLSNTDGNTTVNARVGASADPRNYGYYLVSNAGVFSLLAGNYYAKELKAPPNFAVERNADYSIKTYDFSITNDSQTITISAANIEAPGSVTGKVVDNNGNPKGGAEVGIFPPGTTDFTEENSLLPPITTGPNGEFEFANLPPGKYVIGLIEPPTGYTGVTTEGIVEITLTDLHVDSGSLVVKQAPSSSGGKNNNKKNPTDLATDKKDPDTTGSGINPNIDETIVDAASSDGDSNNTDTSIGASNENGADGSVNKSTSSKGKYGPKTGDTSIPMSVLILIAVIAMVGMVWAGLRLRTIKGKF